MKIGRQIRIKLVGMFFIVLVFTYNIVPAFSQSTTVNIQEVTSPGGIKAWLVQDDKLPLISMSFAFRGGVEQDPKEKQGLSVLTASLLTQGAGTYDAQAFQQQLAASSIKLAISSGRDAVQGSLKTLRTTSEKAFELLKLALNEPRFDEDALERERNQQRTVIQIMLGRADWQGRRALFAELFKDHPYAYRSLGTDISVKSITQKDVIDYAASHFARDNLLIAVTGAISAKELAPVIDEVFGSLPAKAKLKPIKNITSYPTPAEIVIEREGTQTDILFAMPMLRWQDPDWYAAEIVNYVLGGGGFSSRLMNVVRDQEGLTYGIGTSLASMDFASLLIGQASTDNAKTGNALDQIKEVWRKLYSEGLTNTDIEAAKDYLTGSLPLALTSTGAIADVLLSIQLENLGIDYLNRRNNFIRRVSDEDIKRVLTRWFDPENLTVVMVGKPLRVNPTETQQQASE